MDADARRGRLKARPRIVADAGPAGLRRLGLDATRDAWLYVPSGLRAPMALALVLHDAGGDARQALDLLAPAAAATGVVLLAPTAVGRTWDLLDGGLGPDVARLDATLERAFLDYPIGGDRIAIAGFGDGASYALSLGLANGDLYTDVIAFAPGSLRPPALRGNPRVYVAHGRGDDLAPLTAARALVAELRRGGRDVVFREHDGGRTPPPDVSREALARLGGADPEFDLGNAARVDAATPADSLRAS